MRQRAHMETDPGFGPGFFGPDTNYRLVSTPVVLRTAVRFVTDLVGRAIRCCRSLAEVADRDEAVPPPSRPGCDACRFWQDRADLANADADRFALQLAALGARPAPLFDGNQARTVVDAPTLQAPVEPPPSPAVAIAEAAEAHQMYGGWLAGFPGGVG